ncbi:transcriptional regulator BetI [Pelagibacterium xiamenense]|uniref:transcriptional regulator BetI n=1 Tax=Pelagibacterium xiamenense TaxID=2901140 RepID=UPI001E2C6579|nr:transcriptional regulator BetI [Pelagibacterium xiamenense]MCD7060692.1 transcriptional regulator BetI [Pelagibacterium xiamenense]
MPKIGMPILRRKALISAAIAEIGEAGSLEVTVSQIARRAGVSSALAHHYFGSKDQIFLAAMRQVLETFRIAVRERLRLADTPEERIRAIIDASFEQSQFEREIVAAWLTFYVRALQSRPERRLLQIYAKRLNSNLLFNLRQLFDDRTAEKVAQGLASMIDGFYIRHALQDQAPDREGTRDMVKDYLNLWLERTART